ncbi:CAP domain-containing protein [Roseofilum capinflatum]|uniref:CAP domain-containing protein n=1 Tax=Roseofilum capinflatum BLCC-M114 TaxID=3022440 RepID=A0ABT7B445_9CYAN|nr:CAP domain-containing protein [Roseofilum capinflatum]MDJ1173063.1 CAP domain-containing protein [Roseofilum capinflatum BLCC-M114]
MIDIFNPLPGDGLEPEEQKLYTLINEYRGQNGLPAIPLSNALTLVANRHVQDVAENLQITIGDSRNPHSWSWGAYDPDNESTYPNIWEAPQRLQTGYPGNGYENFFLTSAPLATAEQAFNSWINSPDHNATILNQGDWQRFSWDALGVGLYEGYGALWFGDEPDPTGAPPIGGSPTPSPTPTPSPNLTPPSLPPLPPSPPTPQPTPFILGSEANDQIMGTAGVDTILALGGDDIAMGNSGNDYVNGNLGNDQVAGDFGDDSVRGGQGNDFVTGGEGNDFVFGDRQNDQVFGDNGDDILYGGQNEDYLDGGAGNDILYGDLGADVLIGGAGNDIFVLRPDAPDLIFFNDLEDFIGLTGGLSFNSLTFNSGIGDLANSTLIAQAGTNQILAILSNVNPSQIDARDFVTL